MKPWLPVLFVGCLLSCANNGENTTVVQDTAALRDTNSKDTRLLPQSATLAKSDYYIWEVDANARTIKRNAGLPAGYLQVDTLIAGINERFPNVLLEKSHFGNDTLYTKISDAGYLTNRMGSLGAESYIANAVLNLTAVSGVRYVRIDFTEGSHAAPDVWSKASFSHYKEADSQ